MVNARGLGRPGLLAVGLGIGAAMASTPGVASADDFQISIDGLDLFPTAGNTATATSGMGDIAIATGAGSVAISNNGVGDFAFADGTNSLAQAGFGGNFDSATAVGTSSVADAGAGSFDFATAQGPGTAAADFGNGDLAFVVNTGSVADVAEAGGAPSILGSNDIAFVLGTDSIARAGVGATLIPSDFDLAGVFGDGLTTGTVATGGNFLADILPMLF